MILSLVWWKIALGGLCLGFGFAAGAALFGGILSLFKRGGA